MSGTVGLLLYFFNLSEASASKFCKNFPLNSFIFVRHGESQWTPKMISHGPQDLSLSDTGRYQVAACAKNLQSFCLNFFPYPSCVYSSDLKRAKETAQVIQEQLNPISLIIKPGLQERYFGDHRLLSTTSSDTPPDAELKDQFRIRVLTCVEEILSTAKNPIIVAHSGVFQCLTAHLCPESKDVKIDFAEAYLFSSQSEGWTLEKVS